ncbi:MAG TPA: hypothetical protein VKT32_00795 [Chthonomonadaceae bacterium]|nr:hypothetical protein [Chthonomonadaceae bacterium]
MACVWMMFGALLPVLAAVLLLLGAAGEYLFPISYQITAEGVFANTFAGRNALPWKEARRCWRERGGLVVSPLAKPSRLDAFRGVQVRFASDGEPGDSASVLEVIRRCAPDLLSEAVGAAPPRASEES